ncbi:glycosyltransferase family 2 protein [Methanobacterium formicicum]|uniref:Family 2 glycosyl transferase n=1 Tax=Methanobacterium formicicum (strain DSM 3637 / PP1) TaxID=1204725 RepID=K2R484_METFP|nr:glycosyltransferase family 2 protein [Methanobacterium formicicum]EKF86022.1 family 2 glycosyl transferase [Methanobacterium formicicum DSM 3637]
MKYPRVAIIIVNFNGWKDTIECLESVYNINYPNFSVVLVDNNSNDESLSKIREYCKGKLEIVSEFFDYNLMNKPIFLQEFDNDKNINENINHQNFSNNDSDSLILIKNKENYGFAEGNNIGIRFSLNNLDPAYILLLNNDTVVGKNFLDELVKTGENNREIGILGPKIYSYDNPDVIWSAGCKISWKLSRGIQISANELDQGQFNTQRKVEYVSGSAFLIKTEVIQKIGLMDRKYFLYFEESDWTLRANQAGYESLYVPTAEIWHKVSQSGGGMSKPTGLYYITRNRWIFMKKWANRSDYAFFVTYQIIGFFIFPIVLIIYYRNQKLFLTYYRGFFDGINQK